MNTWNGMYEYKNFTIWSPSEKEWIAEPNWCEKALDNYKYHIITHSTISKAKKWISEEGIHLKEKYYL